MRAKSGNTPTNGNKSFARQAVRDFQSSVKQAIDVNGKCVAESVRQASASPNHEFQQVVIVAIQQAAGVISSEDPCTSLL